MSSNKYSKPFPWPSIKVGQGFFIPCLNTEEMRKFGLSQALQQRVFQAKAVTAVRDGLIGVWFYR